MRLIDIDNLHIEGKPSTSIEFDVGVIYAVECVKSMPTVDAVPVVHGHWKYSDCAVICSRCNNVIGGFPDMEKDAIKELMEDDKYCYNCGAKMDEEDEE